MLHHSLGCLLSSLLPATGNLAAKTKHKDIPSLRVCFSVLICTPCPRDVLSNILLHDSKLNVCHFSVIHSNSISCRGKWHRRGPKKKGLNVIFPSAAFTKTWPLHLRAEGAQLSASHVELQSSNWIEQAHYTLFIYLFFCCPILFPNSPCHHTYIYNSKVIFVILCS